MSSFLNNIITPSKTTVSNAATVPAHDFHVDTRTGFMPPEGPPARLPIAWEPWELTLGAAIDGRLQLGDKPDVSEEEKANSQAWRARVRRLPILPTNDLMNSEVNLRRAHHVLSFMLHFFVQSLPPDAPVSIPPPLSVPLLQVSARLQLPPVLTFADNVLYNWELKVPSEATIPALDNIRSQSLFTGSIDEEEFYLCSARIELRGVEALELMRATMDEVFVSDAIAVRRITTYLHRMSVVINELKVLLLAVRKDCDPEKYYREVRPWFRGEDSDIQKRKWVFEGIEQDPSLQEPKELSGPSAGQSSLVHVLDIFLSIDNRSSPSPDKPSFLTRMQSYMPRQHRAFLNHLASNPRPVREFVLSNNDQDLLAAYNAVVRSLKEFRDAHMIIATLYIIGPARRAAMALKKVEDEKDKPVKGTGGTDLVKFLKGTRDRTTETLIPVASS